MLTSRPSIFWVRATVALCVILSSPMNAAEPQKTKDKPVETHRATFGGGCFWCVEAVFNTLKGVQKVTSGYSGGTVENPTYKQVCGGDTGHAEVIQIEFDPAEISYDDLLDLFWEAHDPTTLNRQGADEGTQYRSIILCQDDSQKQAAEKSKKAAQGKFPKPIVTEIGLLKKFYPAEDDHQDFYRNNQGHPYCRAVILPKLQKLQKKAKGSSTGS